MAIEEFDLSRLTPCERELWQDRFAGPSEASLAMRLWSFAQACQLFCEGVPDVVAEKSAELDPENLIHQYVDNVRRARDRGELRRK